MLIEATEPRLSVRKQCEILGYNRSNVYYEAHPREYHSKEFREKIMAKLDYIKEFSLTGNIPLEHNRTCMGGEETAPINGKRRITCKPRPDIRITGGDGTENDMSTQKSVESQ